MAQRALIIGLARSGVACARLLSAEGWDVDAVDRDETPELRERAAALPGVHVRLGGYDADVVAGYAMICPSPGVRWDAPELAAARAAGIPVRSEIDLFLERCPAHVIGITGTNGKTTTTALTGALLRAAGIPVHVGGNIGDTVLDRVTTMTAADWVVLELSSFQLETLDPARQIEAGAVLNVTPDHLDRHGTMENYAAIKERCVTMARRRAVLNADDPVTRAMAPQCSAPVSFFGSTSGSGDGATIVGDSVVCLDGNQARSFMPVADIPLFGAHNRDNVLAAVCLARAAGAGLDAIAAGIRAFTAVDHRLQPVVEEDGVLWVNDSKATNVDAALKALAAFPDRSIVWIGGGSHKGVGPDILADAVAARTRIAILNGATAADLDTALAARGFAARHVVDGLADAVALARRLSRPGDVVLLAPGYASFDQFSGYDERGRAFAALVTGARPAARTEV